MFIVSMVSASQFYIARGDPVWIEEQVPNGTCWYFPTSGIGDYYDIPATLSITGNTFCHLQGDKTANMIVSKYTLIYQEPAIINRKTFSDISWVNNKLISSLSLSDPIDESGNQGQTVMTDLKKLIITNGLNTFSEDQIFLEDPYLKLGDLSQTSENFYIAKGTSNFADGTKITIKIDEDRYRAQHNTSFTYHSEVVRESTETVGIWTANMLMPIQEMPPGWHTITIYSGDLVTESQFKVSEREWSPNPTPPQYVKYLSDGNIAPVYVTIVQEKIVDHYIDKWLPATPTPAITDAIGQKIEYPYKTGDTIPSWVALLALIGVAGLVLMRDWKWNQ